MRRHALLYQLDTRLLLRELGGPLGRRADLDDVPDALVDGIAARGFDWAWLLGVWTTGPVARAVSRSRPDWREGFLRALPDLAEDDITGSPFAVQSYEVSPDFGGDAALSRLRERLARRGVKLMLDFVPNHAGLDHPWVTSHPEWLVEGSAEDLAREPGNFVRLGGRVFAHGRDPYFPGWPDTVQLGWRHPGLRAAMVEELRRVAARCDGVRCDMAMLLLPDVFRRTWGDRSLPRDGSAPADAPFWPGAIERVRRERPRFVFLAEAYWGLEEDLQRQGFDFTYDKPLYDRLVAGDGPAVLERLAEPPAFQDRSARFLENHDEARAAAAFPPAQHRAAATIAFLVPGLRFFHEGQLEGRRVQISVHLGRRPPEEPDPALRAFYERLLGVLARRETHDGRFTLRACRPAWEGNATCDRFVAMSWEGERRARLLACVNYGPTRGQAFADAAFPGLEGRRVVLADLLGDARYERDGDDLCRRGLYLDLPAWGHHAFEIRES